MKIGRQTLILFLSAVVLVIAVWALSGERQSNSDNGNNHPVAVHQSDFFHIDVVSGGDGVAHAPIEKRNAGGSVPPELSGRLQGRAVDTNSGRPVTHFSISLFADGRLDVSNHPDFDAEFEDPDGDFEISGLSNGKFDVLARASDYQPIVLRGVEIGSQSADILISFETSRRIAGRVLENATGSAIAGARVTAIIISDGTTSARRIPLPGQWAIADDDGQFELNEVPQGEAMVRTRAKDYATLSTKVGDMSESDIVVMLHPAALVAGRIVDVDGSAAGRGSIYMVRVRENPPMSWRRRADESGDFQVRELPPGQFVLTASSSEGRSEPVTITLTVGEQLENLVLQIVQGNELIGQVSGLMDGENVRRVIARRSDNPTPPFLDETYADLNSAGDYKLYGMPSGYYVVRAITTTGRSLSKPIELRGGGAESIDFVFVGSASVEGRIVRGLVPLKGVLVDFRPVEAGHPRGSTQTTIDGRYRIEGLANGEYEIVIWNSSAYSKNVNVSGETRYDILIE